MTTAGVGQINHQLPTVGVPYMHDALIPIWVLAPMIGLAKKTNENSFAFYTASGRGCLTVLSVVRFGFLLR